MPPPMSETGRTATAPEEPFMWRCTRCQRHETFGSESLRRFLNEGWPVCCGEVVMGFLQTREKK